MNKLATTGHTHYHHQNWKEKTLHKRRAKQTAEKYISKEDGTETITRKPKRNPCDNFIKLYLTETDFKINGRRSIMSNMSIYISQL